MSSESSTAFYKGVKFWLVLLLAAGLAALLWRMWRQEPTEVPPSVGAYSLRGSRFRTRSSVWKRGRRGRDAKKIGRAAKTQR